MDKRIGIFGVGAVGSYLGAFLTREGHDVTLIDMWGEHVDVMNQKGLRVTGTQGEFTVPVKAVHLTDAQDIKEPFDIAFLAVKSYDTEWMAHFLKRFISSSSIVVGSQNCMNDRLIASIVGYEREIPCVMSGISVALWEPGHVTRGGQPGRDRGHDVFRIGELHGQITNRVNELVEKLRGPAGFAFDTETTGVDPMRAGLVGISFSNESGHAWYVPVGHNEGEQPPYERALAALRPLFEDEAVPKTAHNANFDMMVLEQAGMKPRGITFDSMIAAALCGRRAIGLKQLAMDCFHIEMTPITDLIGRGRKQITMAEVPIADAAPGTRVTVETPGGTLAATVVALPFYDPKKAIPLGIVA